MLIGWNLLVVKRTHVWQRITILFMQVYSRFHVLRFLFSMCLNFQLLKLSLSTSLESIHVVLISTTVYYHWIVNLIAVLGLTKSTITIFHLTCNFWVSTDSVIIIDCGYQSILFSSVVIWYHGWLLNSNNLSRCHLFISIHLLLLSYIITLSPLLTLNTRSIGQNLKLI